jgi:hypothetical protein
MAALPDQIGAGAERRDSKLRHYPLFLDSSRPGR